MLGNIMIKIVNIISKIVLMLFGILAVYFLYLAGFSSAMTDINEHTYLVGDSIWVNLGIAVSLIVISAVLLNKNDKLKTYIARISSDERLYYRLLFLLLGILAVMACVFVLSVDYMPNEDQGIVRSIVNAWMEKDYSSFDKGAYLDSYPNQLGIILFEYGLSTFFGGNYVLVFRIINIVSLVAIYHDFSEISKSDGADNSTCLIIALIGILFIPLTLYSTFVYGNIIGLALAISAFKCVIRFIECCKYRYFFMATFFALFSIAIKNNYLIFVIGLVVYLIFRLAKQPKIQTALMLFALVMVMLGTTKVVNIVTYSVTGHTPGKGMSPFAWVAMGMQHSGLYDGWWNEYHTTLYEECGYDRDLQRELAVKEIKSHIAEYKSNPMNALDFFARKNASQWNNPEFESIWINQRMYHAKNKNAVLPRPLYLLLGVSGSHKYFCVMNIIYFLILFGVVLEVICSFGGFLYADKRVVYDTNLFYKVTIIGGFVFHTFWEGKGQYCLSYAVLFIPLCAVGYTGIIRTLYAERKDVWKKKAVYSPFALIFLLAIIIQIGIFTPFNKVFALGADTKAYNDYVRANATCRLVDGDYILQPYLSDGTYLSVGDDSRKHGSPVVTGNEKNAVGFVFSNRTDDVYIQLNDSRYLYIPDGNKIDDTGKIYDVRASKSSHGKKQRWQIKASLRVDGCYNIVYGADDRLALAYDEENGTVYATQRNDSDSQVWRVEIP